MKIAIVSEDNHGPAYGVGANEAEARADAANWGFSGGKAVEITDAAFDRVMSGNPDAWTE